jgi:predicted RNA-binding Zn ribbon-like protein
LQGSVAGGLRGWSRANPEGAEALLEEAKVLREALFHLFTAKRPPKDEFLILQRALGAAPVRRRLVYADGRYGWEIAPPDPTLQDLLAPVLWSAADLLVGDGRQRVQRCANSECLWLFLDESKNATRRWCDMASCGNRAKARRHYLKIRKP